MLLSNDSLEEIFRKSHALGTSSTQSKENELAITSNATNTSHRNVIFGAKSYAYFIDEDRSIKRSLTEKFGVSHLLRSSLFLEVEERG